MLGFEGLFVAVPAFRRTLLYGRSVLLLLIIWFGASRLLGNPVLLPGPDAVLPQIVVFAQSGELWRQIAISLRRLLIGYSMAAGCGLALGIFMTSNRFVRAIADPLIELVRPVSGIAWIPLLLAIFGVGDVLPVAIIFYGAVFPFVVNTNAAFDRVPRGLIAAAQTLGAQRLRILLEVIVPAALPDILTGARIALGLAWVSIVAAELIGAPTGVGFSIEWYAALLMTQRVLAWVVIVGVLGYLTDLLALGLQRRLTPWVQIHSEANNRDR